MDSKQKTRFGLVGYGAWGTHHARAIRGCDRAELVAIVESSRERRDEARSEHPEVRICEDLDEMLRRDPPDVVDVVLPNHLHYEVSKAVLESGRHLLLEKPMTNRTEQCEELIRVSRERGCVLALVQQFRLSSLWGEVKRLIDGGAIGEPQYALIELWRNPYRPGSDGWRYDIGRVGSWILEEPIHFFDLARWYFQGAGDPVSVYARATARDLEHPELQDNFCATLNFANGSYAVIAQTLAAWQHHQVAKLTGSEGALWASWSGEMDRTFHPTFSLELQRRDKPDRIPINKPAGEVYELPDVIADMIEALGGNTSPAATGDDGRWAVAMCLKAEESVWSGECVAF